MPKSTKATPNAKPQEIGVLVGVQSPMTSKDINSDLDELESLLTTAGAKNSKAIYSKSSPSLTQNIMWAKGNCKK